jgi:hypothetical protein
MINISLKLIILILIIVSFGCNEQVEPEKKTSIKFKDSIDISNNNVELDKPILNTASDILEIKRNIKEVGDNLFKIILSFDSLDSKRDVLIFSGVEFEYDNSTISPFSEEDFSPENDLIVGLAHEIVFRKIKNNEGEIVNFISKITRKNSIGEIFTIYDENNTRGC